MPVLLCSHCGKRREIPDYLAALPLRCTGCGQMARVVTEEPPIPLEPVVRITEDPELPPLVPLTTEPSKSDFKVPDEGLTPTQLSDMLKSIGSIDLQEAPIPLTPAPVPTNEPVSEPVASPRKGFWNRFTGR